MEEIISRKDKTGHANKLIRSFVEQLLIVKPVTEYLIPMMTEIKAFFRVSNNHTRHLQPDLQKIYQDHLKNKYAPMSISANAKYKLHQPKIVVVKANMLTHEEQYIEDDHGAIVKPATLKRTSNTQSTNKSYTSDIYIAYRMTQK